MGPLILVFIIPYVVLLVIATSFGGWFAVKQGWSPRKRQGAAVVGFMVVFLPMFWDWVPTVWLHSYYCEKYGGLTVNKTPEQWKQENPGVAETLVRQKPPLQVGLKDKFYLQLNQRFRWEIEQTEKVLWLRQNEDRVVDSKTEEVLARSIDFSTGQSGHNLGSFRDFKPWMYRDSCDPQGNYVTRKKFNELLIAFQTMGGQQ